MPAWVRTIWLRKARVTDSLWLDAGADAARAVLLVRMRRRRTRRRHLREDAAAVLDLDRLDGRTERIGRPEGIHRAIEAAIGLPLPGTAADDHHPRGHRQQQQQDGHRVGDHIALRPEVGKAQL